GLTSYTRPLTSHALRGGRGETTQRARRYLPILGDADSVRLFLQPVGLRTARRRFLRAAFGVECDDRQTPPPPRAAAAPAGRGALQPGPPVLDRGPRLRPRLPRPPHGGAAARTRRPTGGDRVAHHRTTPRPHSPALGDVCDRGDARRALR